MTDLGFSTEAATGKQSRRLYLGGDSARTPMYFVVDDEKVHVTNSKGDDCWSIAGTFAGISDYWTEAGEYEPSRKAVVALDIGDEVIKVVFGIATHAALGMLQSLSIVSASKGGTPEYVRLSFKRGDRKKTVVFCGVSATNDLSYWHYVSTQGDTTFAHKRDDSTAGEHNATLLNRLLAQASEESEETYEFVEEF